MLCYKAGLHNIRPAEDILTARKVIFKFYHTAVDIVTKCETLLITTFW